MKLVALFDSSADAAPSWFKSAVNSVLDLMGSMFSNPITVTLAFGWGEVNGAPLSDDAAAASRSLGNLESYATLRQGLASSPAKAAQAAAAAMPLEDPTSGGKFVMPVALQKATGMVSPNTGEVDGYVGINAGLDWSTSQTSIQRGQFDLVGALEHEVSEALGRLGGLSYSYGSGVYGPMDLFRYSSVGVRDFTAEGGFFSVQGQRMLQPFNDPTQGGDPSDWLPSIVGDAFGDSYQGTAGPLSGVDFKAMRALGYRTVGTATLGAVDLASSAAVSSTVSFQGQGRIGLSGTVADLASSVQVYAGKRDLGPAQVDSHGFWSLNARLRSGPAGPITAVVTDSSGSESVVQGSFTITANIQAQPYAVEQDTYAADGTLAGQVFANRDGSTYLNASVSTKRNGHAVYTYSGGSYFDDKNYAQQVDVVDSAGALLRHTTSAGNGAVSSATGPSSQDAYSLLVGEGAKSFVFGEHPGHALITNFTASGDMHDTISLPSSEFASIAAVLHDTHMAGGDAVIAISPSDAITVQGVTKAELRAHPGCILLHG